LRTRSKSKTNITKRQKVTLVEKGTEPVVYCLQVGRKTEPGRQTESQEDRKKTRRIEMTNIKLL
jgi:hypothetical protein